MLIETAVALVVRCCECGKLSLVTESLFSFRREIKKVKCGCGRFLVKLGLGAKGSLGVGIMCFLCEEWHQVTMPRSLFWGGRVKTLYCPESGIELCLVGAQEPVRERALSGNLEIMGLTSALPFDDFFHNADVIFEILNCLYQLNHDSLISCRCGNREMKFNLFKDRIEIRCLECGKLLVVPAVSPPDLERIRGLAELKLEQELLSEGEVPREGKNNHNM